MANKLRQDWDNLWQKDNLSSTLGSFGTGAMGALNVGIQNAKIKDTTEEEALINAAENTQFGSGSYDNLLSSFGVTNMSRTNYTADDLRGLTEEQLAGNTLLGMAQGAASGVGIWDRIIKAGVAGVSGLTGALVGGRKAREKADELNARAEEANNRYLSSFSNAAANTHNTMFNSSLLNMASKGGKIYIKPENRGKFTDYCGGKVTADCIARGKRSSSSTIRKRATFAANARKWHHALGGNLFDEGGLIHQHGGIFSNGVTFIGNGGTHEQNPFEGVQIGVDAQGTPNMVEEGEVIWNDYVFSNRLKPTKEFKDKYKVKGETFADVAKEIQKESEERPNDPISNNGLEDSMMKLMIEQEGIRNKKPKINNRFDIGGDIPFMHNGKSISREEFLRLVNLGDAQVNYGFFTNPQAVNLREAVGKTNMPILPKVSSKNTLESTALKEQQRAITPITSSSIETPTYPNTKSNSKNSNLLRYAPVIGSAAGVFSDLLGITNKPDYSNINLIQDATNRFTPINYTPIGTYLSYNPMDKNFYSARLGEQAGATRRAITNQAINPGAAMAGLLAADYNAQTQLGGLFRQAEEYNQAQREKVAGFNRQTDAMNAEMAMKAAMANQKADELRLKSAITQAQMREQADATASAARSANLTNLFDNLGAVGKESFIMDMIEKNPDLLYNWMGEYKNNSACGGKINRKRRK